MSHKVTLTILGQPVSKANSRRLFKHPRTGRPMFVKSPEGIAYLDSIKRQVPPLRELLAGELTVVAKLYYKTERPDLDESIILDGLEGLIYKNDRQVRERHIYHNVDRDNPRVEVAIFKRVKADAGPLFGNAA